MEAEYIVFEKKGEIGFGKENIAEPSEKQALIRTICSLISPGTEMNYYEGRHSDFATGKAKFPVRGIGYSVVGEIVRFGGKETGDLKIGDRVLAMIEHESMGVADIDELIKIPENLNSDAAVYGILSSIALHGIREANIRFGENVLITGMGLVGQLALRLARLSPARNIIVTDMLESRLEVARMGGADYCISGNDDLQDAVMKITNGRGCEVIIEASGNTKVIASALKTVARRGKLVILGCPHGECDLDLYAELQRREVAMVGSYQPLCPHVETAYMQWTQKRNREVIVEYLSRGKLDFSNITLHKTPYRKAGELYALLSGHKEISISGIIDWEEK